MTSRQKARIIVDTLLKKGKEGKFLLHLIVDYEIACVAETASEKRESLIEEVANFKDGFIESVYLLVKRIK